MKSIQRYLFIPKLFFLFSGMFILGAQLGKLHARLSVTPFLLLSVLNRTAGGSVSRPKASVLSEMLPSKNLRPYNAYYADDTNDKKIYLTFDCGYENGNTPLILDALKKHQAPAAFLSSEILFQIILILSSVLFRKGISLEIIP